MNKIVAPLPNHSIKEDIRAYWSKRAETFDLSIGHRIEDSVEAPAWQRLIRHALGDLSGARILDLACGTGEVSRMLLALGADVTGVDFAEPMLARAKAKHAGRAFTGRLSDVESLHLEPDAHYDGIIARHLVWTLSDPEAAFAAWFRVLKPGGRILLIDGDWVTQTLTQRLMKSWASKLAPQTRPYVDSDDLADHQRILRQLPYRDGLTFERLSGDLARHGFTRMRRLPLWPVYLVGMRHAPLAEILRLNAARRFAIAAEKPLSAAEQSVE